MPPLPHQSHESCTRSTAASPQTESINTWKTWQVPPSAPQKPPFLFTSSLHLQRDKGHAIYPYPCISQLRFLSLHLSSQPTYPAILSRLKAGHGLLDVGCCFGQDIRKSVTDGAPAEQIYGLDKEAVFIDLGSELFRDRGSLRSKFVVADIADPSADLGELEGKMDILWVSSFLHL
ncbi:hypothetical protein MMC30_004970 [Trapelia coarctata]|nr:hypothetical protein [Trapelia coarctata]